MPKKQTSIQDKGRIYEAHKRGEDAILLGRQLGKKSKLCAQSSKQYQQETENYLFNKGALIIAKLRRK